MPDFFIKPIFWNTLGYKKPSGFKARSGYPAENGFGHEEWNNSKKMLFVEDGVQYRAFHTERMRMQIPEASASFVFLISSHDGVQDLVGIAGNATCLIVAERRRRKLAKKLNLDKLWRQTWKVDSVRSAFEDDKDAFREVWERDVRWIPNWICPDEMFLWLETPINIKPHAPEIVGKSAFSYRYSAFKRIDARCALAIMDCVPENDRSTTWQRLVSTVRNCDPLSQYRDLEDIRKKSGPSTTAREAMTQARIGQGAFRRELEARWGSRCAVTGIGIRETLIASHIKDWKSSSNNERLDKNNGLLLAAHIDALFDKGLISFDDCGYMLVSQRVSKSERKRLGIPKPLRCKLCNGEREYLSIHRRNHGFALRSKARSP